MGLFLETIHASYISPIQQDEVVTFFPTVGYPIEEGKVWALPIHGWIYRPSWGTEFPQQLPHELELKKEEETPLFKERMKAFMVDNQENQVIAIRLGEKFFLLKESAANGHFSETIHLSNNEVNTLRQGEMISFKALTRPEDTRHFEGHIHLVSQEGVSVISDIDDTIKITQVNDKTALFSNTFLRPFEPVPKMNTLYQDWAQHIQVSFHYVSASPWQLYLPLIEFIKNHRFPLGSVHLRLFRWKDSSWLEFFKSPREYKMRTIEFLIACGQQRRFILVGDSGESDPEIYADVARQYPRQIALILIHDVTGEEAETKRYQETFKGLPPSLWKISRDPSTLQIGFSEIWPNSKKF